MKTSSKKRTSKKKTPKKRTSKKRSPKKRTSRQYSPSISPPISPLISPPLSSPTTSYMDISMGMSPRSSPRVPVVDWGAQNFGIAELILRLMRGILQCEKSEPLFQTNHDSTYLEKPC